MTTRRPPALALAALALGVLVHCTDLGGGGGGALQPNDASITLTVTGAAEQKFDYDTNINEISVTPPVAGIFIVTFTQGDPSFSLTMRVNSERLEEGQRVTFPLGGGLTSGDLQVTVDHGGRSYSSERPTTSGEVAMDILTVTEDAVDFRTSFNLVLGSDTAETANIVGFVEAHFGDTTFIDEADAGEE